MNAMNQIILELNIGKKILYHAKMIAKCEKQKVYSGVFRITFFVSCPFFRFLNFVAFCTRISICAKIQRISGFIFSWH